MPWITKDGRTVEEARAAVIAQLGLAPEDLEIEVLNEGAKGLFGFGGEPAVVRARPRTEAVDVRSAFHDRPPGTPPPVRTPPEEVSEQEEQLVAVEHATENPSEEKADLAARQEITREVAVEMVEGILKRMGLEGEVGTRIQEGTVYVEVSGDNMGILIGRGGATLEALQELVRAGVQRKLKARGAVVVDVESYWDRRRGRRSTSSRGTATPGNGS